MIVYPSRIYEDETSIVDLYPDWRLLPYVRLTCVIDTAMPGNALSPWCGPPFSFVLAFAKVRFRSQIRRLHRIAYLRVADIQNLDALSPGFDDGSDNRIKPASFIAGEPLTQPPTEFGLGDGGKPGLFKVHLAARLKEANRSWQCHFERLGQPIQTTNKETWGVEYGLPVV